MNIFDLPIWLREQIFYRAKLNNAPLDSGDDFRRDQGAVQVKAENANLISAKTKYGSYKLLLDLDVEHHYVRSTTPGHGHLYINVDLTDKQLEEIVTVLQKHGILQRGIVNQLDREESITLRVPGSQKGNPEDDASLEELLEMRSEKKNSKDKFNPF